MILRVIFLSVFYFYRGKYTQQFWKRCIFDQKNYEKVKIFDVFVAKVIEKLPFKPNESQTKVINLLADFLFCPSQKDRVFVLKGYAGTGKTSLVGALVKVLSEAKMKSRLMAPTGRAAKVFASFSGHTVLTIHKTIYRQSCFNMDFEGFQLMDNLQSQTLFVCDEASMISSFNDGSHFGTGNLLDDLIEYVYSAQGCKLLLIGDTAQLPPVGQDRSSALDVRQLESYGLQTLSFELTDVARQQLESGILANATMLRNILNAGDVNRLPRLLCCGFPDIIRISGYDFPEFLSQSYHRQGIDETIIITRSNLKANRFNIEVRNRILEREEELSAGDRLLVVKNNYYWGKEIENLPFIANGDVIQVRRVRHYIDLYGYRFAEVSVTFPDYDYDAEMILLLDALTAEGPCLPLESQQKLFYAVMEDYADIPSRREQVRAVKANKYFNALQIKYGYAVTCHKSQGGQWNDVYLDLSYINTDHLGIGFYRWLYTAVTRARKHLYLVGMSDDMEQKSAEKFED